jgi:pyruvate carboxylase
MIKTTFKEVNDLFGDIVKVTPSSKVVGDMAQYLVSNNLTVQDVMEKGDTISFPESVVSFFKGEIGQPVGGFPKELQKIILKDREPLTVHPNEVVAPIDINKDFEEFKLKFDSSLEFTEYLSYKMFPKVYEEYYKFKKEFGDVSIIPTKCFFFGLNDRDETSIEIKQGMSILLRFMSVSQPDENGIRNVYYRLNGQTRSVEIVDRSLKIVKHENAKVDKNNPEHIGAPLQGLLSKIFVKTGQSVQKNEPLFVIEAMKMETTITATTFVTVKDLHLKEGTLVNADDLVMSVI